MVEISASRFQRHPKLYKHKLNNKITKQQDARNKAQSNCIDTVQIPLHVTHRFDVLCEDTNFL